MRKDFCAFANSTGGKIVFGVSESKTTGHMEFRLHGWQGDNQETIFHTISNKIAEIEPLPTFSKHFIEDVNETFYFILDIKTEPSKKPFFLKNKSSCYIRIGNISREATRSIILSLITGHIVTYEGKIRHANYISEIFNKLIYIHLSNEFNIHLRVPQYPNEFHNFLLGYYTEN